MQEIVLPVPRCWADLLNIQDFNESVMDGDKREKPLDDPTPYYDDHRTVYGRFSDCFLARVELMSGQRNYFLVVNIDSPQGYEESDVTHDIADGDDWKFDAGDGYRVVVRLAEERKS